MNGLHIRTLPGRRWNNPVLIGAGYGYLAVVDRFGDYDVIRVTDQYAGAGAEGFNSDGMPLDEVNWEEVDDLCRVNTPTGSQCTGLKINQNGVLVAGVTDGGKARFIKADILGRLTGQLEAHYEGEITVESHFEDMLGETVGNPAELETKAGEMMNSFMGLSKGGGSSAVYHLNLATGEIERLLGLPLNDEPMAVGHAAQIVSILCGSGGIATRVMRFHDKDNSFLMSDITSPQSTPSPESYAVQHTYFPKDYPLPDGASEEDIKNYLKTAKSVNKIGDTEVSSGVTREIDPVQSSDALNENRTQAAGIDATSFYQVQNYEIPISFIDIPANSGLIFFESCFNTLTELYNKFEIAQDGSPTSTIDTTKLIFRAVHGTHYDYLSDGGFTYGCRLEAGGVSSYTNGLKGIHLATDADDAPGSLKPLRDLKAAIVDAGTGLVIYRHLKPLGYPFYSGSYVTLTPVNGVSRSECTVEAETVVESFDGIKRPDLIESPDYPAEYAGTKEYDSPWTLFIRHVHTPRNYITLNLKQASWNAREEDGSFKPEWNPHTQANPVEGSASWQAFWPWGSSHDAPDFEESAAGGFFALDAAKVKTTRHAQARADIADLEDQNVDLQAAIDTGQLTQAQADANQTQIETNTNSIAQLQLIFESEDESIWAYPSGTFRIPFDHIGLSTPQDTADPNEIDPPLVEPESEQVTAPGVAPALSVVQLGEEQTDTNGRPIYRGCVIEPGFKGWVAVEVKFTKEGVSSDGITGYTNPEARANGLGRGVGSAPPFHSVIGHSSGTVYEAGYIASEGAMTKWDVGVSMFSDMGTTPLGQGDAPDLFACRSYRFYSPDEVMSLAPTEIGELLANTLGVNSLPRLDNEYHRGFVYGCYDPLWGVSINALMTNLAFGVYRYGYRTFNVENGTAASPICAKTDPGYFVSHNCEAIDCGNVQCNSFLFSNNKLYASDYVYPVIRTPILSVQGHYRMKEDPYKDMGIGVGRFITIYIEFNLNNPPWNFDVVMP
ncbi:MAG: hypothetical protein WC479_11965 [Candidatus Izemoplasmatales bacterium]